MSPFPVNSDPTDSIPTQPYAVVGNPIGHSLSPRIHQAFAEQTGHNISYEALELPSAEFSSGAEQFFADGGRGLNVTVPFKQDAFGWVTEHDPLALAAQAVNTIVPLEPGYRGYNTDGLGLLEDLTSNLGLRLSGMRILLLGAGGAAQGVMEPLLASGAQSLTVANRTFDKASRLVGRFSASAERAGVSLQALELSGVGTNVDTEVDTTVKTNEGLAYHLVINATAGSIAGVGDLVSANSLSGAVCYDMMYGPNTAFCDFAQASGASSCFDGLGMLVEQAAAAFQLWRGAVVDTAPILEQLRSEGLARPLPEPFASSAAGFEAT